MAKKPVIKAPKKKAPVAPKKGVPSTDKRIMIGKSGGMLGKKC